MALAAGARLGPYEVVSLLGSGGMGEVYRARDTRLDRTVALKILPDALGGDARFRERFDREARAISQLTHPNICTLYDVGEDHGTAFLVMEYLEGETLEARLKKGPLPLDQALAIAIQIAGALDKAHRAGIIHRDLKPGNVMLTKGGAKLLDFGLAKATPLVAPGSGFSMLPTTPPAAVTAQGTILGTFQYMAPEQLEGLEADARTDIFAFGALVYEMLTGRKAFEGKSQASLISAIMSSEPPVISRLQPMAPATLDQIVRTCLAKHPDDRWQTAADVERQLKWIATSQTPVSTVTGVSLQPPWIRDRRFTQIVLGAAVGCLFGVVMSGVVGWTLNRPPTSEPNRLSIVLPMSSDVNLAGAPSRSLAISPDGTQVVYSSKIPSAVAASSRGLLAVRSLEDRTVRVLPKTDEGTQPFFSPDGKWVGFFTDDALKKVSLAGGDPITLADKLDGSKWGFGAWVGNDIVFTIGSVIGLQRITEDGGPLETLTTVDTKLGERRHRQPEPVADTRAVLFGVHMQGRPPHIEAVMLDTRERHRVLENAYAPRYLKTGHLLFQRGETLLVAPFDAKRLAITGPAVPLGDQVRRDDSGSPDPMAELAVSTTGTLAYLPSVETNQMVGRFRPGGVFDPMDMVARVVITPRVSPDGQFVAFETVGARQLDVMVRDVARGTTTKLTQEGSDTLLAWEPDSKAVAVFSRRQNGSGFYVKDLGGKEHLLWRLDPSGVITLRSGSWSSDGQSLAYTVQSGNQHDIWVLALGEKPVARPLLNSAAAEYSPAFSPDGQWLAYVSNESGRYQVYVRRYPDGARFQVSTTKGQAEGPVWSRDGRDLYFTEVKAGADPPRLMAASVMPAKDSLTLGVPRAIFDMRIASPDGAIESFSGANNDGANYDIFPDGKTFVLVRTVTDPQATREIVLVQHWLDELKRLVPTKN